MLWIASGLGVLLALLWLARLFANARVETVRKAVSWGLAGIGGVVLLVLLIGGRGSQAIWSLLFLGPVAWRLIQSWRTARQFARRGPGGGPASGDETTVETATLSMRLDHASGQMSGRVLRGRHAGQELAELTMPQLAALLADCRAEDPESVPLLEAWLDRVAPEWREADAFAGAESGPAAASGPMTRADALAVLGLEEGATEEEIRAAHRRLMRGAHPDQGGSDWLAARINQARDVLLG